MKKKFLLIITMVLLASAVAMPSLASDPGGQGAGQNSDSSSSAAGGKKVSLLPDSLPSDHDQVYSPFVDFKAKYNDWLDMVHRSHEEEQPHWMTPIVTITPTLQQEIRTDFSFNHAKGLDTNTYVSKGTEIMPTENTEFIFGNPNWVTKDLGGGKQVSGWGDWYTLGKYRLLSSPSSAGDYIVTFMLSASFATGSPQISAGHNVVTPMLSFGKGIKTSIGEFDYQGTVSSAIPDAGISKFGTPITWSSAFQYGNPFNIGGYKIPLWPELETTWVSYPNGSNRGQQQLYLTPGLIAGRFKLTEHTYFVLGAGYQFAVTSDRAYDHQWQITMRIPYF